MRTKRLLIGLLVVTLLAVLVLPGIVAAGPSTSHAAKATPNSTSVVVKPLLPTPKPLLKVGPARPPKLMLEPGLVRFVKAL